MGAVKTAVAALLFVAAAPAVAQERGDPLARWAPLIAEASSRFGLPAGWIERVMRAESGGQTSLGGRPITSPAGAMGLMQLMPGTWAEMRRSLGLGADPHDPRDNILAGAAYLKLMYERFGYPGLFAAYNAGPGRYAAYLEGARTLPAETQDYLRTVTGLGIPMPHTPLAAPLRPSIFAIRATRQEAQTSQEGAGLFAIRRAH